MPSTNNRLLLQHRLAQKQGLGFWSEPQPFLAGPVPEPIKTEQQDFRDGSAHWEKGDFFPYRKKLITSAKRSQLSQMKRLVVSGHAINARDERMR